MKKIIILTLIIVSLIFLVSCDIGIEDIPPSETSKYSQEGQVNNLGEGEAENIEISESSATEQKVEKTICEVNTDCLEGKECIDGECGTIAELYQTDCTNKCNYQEVIISTSDGESYTLKRGQGTYTAVGALEWKTMNVPDYCADENVVIPIKIIKKNYGKVISEEVLTLKK